MAREHLYRLGAALQAAPVLGLEAFRHVQDGGPEPTPTPFVIPGTKPFHLDVDPKTVLADSVIVLGTLVAAALIYGSYRRGKRNKEMYGNTGSVVERLNKGQRFRKGFKNDQSDFLE